MEVIMAELTQIPGDLPLKMVDGNDLSFKIDWATDTSVYSFTATIQPVGSVTTAIIMTVTPINATLGTYTVSVSKTAIKNLPLNVSHKWRMDRIGASPALLTRTVLAGTFTVLDK
jgi:hypothetical protein